MAHRTGTSWGSILRPLVVLVILLIFAYLVRGSIWMTGALVLALLAAAFFAIAIFTQIPARRKK